MSRPWVPVLVTMVLLGCGAVVAGSPSPSASGLATTGPATASPAVADPTASMVIPSPTLGATTAPATPASPEPTPSPTPFETPTPSLPAHRDGLRVRWHGTVESGFGRVLFFNATAAVNGRFVAVGSPDGNRAPAWHSTDGLTWQPGEFRDEPPFDLESVAGGPPGFVAVTAEYPDQTLGVAYTSADGTSWDRADSPLFWGHDLRQVAFVAGRFVAISREGGVFVSSDGREWSVAEDASAAGAGRGLLALAGDESRLWAISQASDGQPLDIWQTGDGLTWAKTATLADSQGAMRAVVAAGPTGLSLIAFIERGASYFSRAWQSLDGVHWTAASNSPTNADDMVATMVGFVAVGHYNTGSGCASSELEDVGVTWTSVDGLAWRQMPEKGWQARVVQEVMLISSNALLGLGVDLERLVEHGSPNGMVWSANLPGTVVDDARPLPSPAAEPSHGCG